ncbi:hypothetical protein GCM10023152_00630 [Agromyces bauzanensis]|uniref:DUF8094 domain-containing protein n=1 Tax=Agromyces bauzanensis TaxID=1308924 RepID=A0A917URF8_9MICO|nr:hypothetical protein GCM10011372_17410 [Agromyces bauzanensis]
MRFALAIVAFVAAAVMIGFGIAQRTVYLDPDRVTLSSELEGQAAYVVVEPDALGAHSGKQTLTVSGSETVFMAYGRASDVEAWLGDEPYVAVRYDAEAEEFASEVVTTAAVDDDGTTATATPTTPTTPPATPEAEAAPDPAASPAGSDLWLDEFTDERSLTTTIDVPDGISVLLASDGAAPAPTDLTVSWPLDNSTPMAGPLIAGGALVFLVGTALLIAGFMHHRRSRGPRRNLPGGRRGKLPSAPKPPSIRRSQVTGGNRRAIGRARRIAIVPLIAVPAIALTACSPDYWPSFDQAPASTAPATTSTPAPTDAPAEDEEAVMEPAVTVQQMERIMRRVAVFTTEVDGARDASAVEQRFTGPALEARLANYTIRGALPDHAAPVAVPASPLTLTLPQQVAGWPTSGRTVLTIAQNSDPTIAPTALVLQQATPRDNYKIVYAMSLAPDADVPEVAPASIGAPLISPEFKGLVLPPGQVAAAYADVLLKGEASESYPLFETEGDMLQQQLGVAGQQAADADLPETADIAFSNAVGDTPTVALATNDSGALVTVSIEQTENVTPNDGGTIGFQEGAPGAALSGFTEKSAKGVQRVIGVQLLFYVPSVGSEEKIRLLGWSENLIAASEVP